MRSSVPRLRVHAAPPSAGSTLRRVGGVPCALVLLASAGFLSAQTAVQESSRKVVELAGPELEVGPAQGGVLSIKLTPGAFIGTTPVAPPDGSLLAERLTVGKNGFASPP
jgi:hypothetical protein